MSKIFWFQLLKSEDLLLFFVSYDNKWRVFASKQFEDVILGFKKLWWAPFTKSANYAALIMTVASLSYYLQIAQRQSFSTFTDHRGHVDSNKLKSCVVNLIQCILGMRTGVKTFKRSEGQRRCDNSSYICVYLFVWYFFLSLL